MGRACPQCLAPLVEKSHRGISLDVCEPCRGVWFDAAELAASLKGPGGQKTYFSIYFDEARLETREEPRGACPGCVTRELRKATWEDVQAATCAACRGIWISGKSMHRLREKLAGLVPMRLPPKPDVRMDMRMKLELVGELVLRLGDLFT